MASCPACGRNVAVARAECLYCGAPLESAPQATPTNPAPSAAAPLPSQRVLVLLDLDGTEASKLAETLALSSYEATLLPRLIVHARHSSSPAVRNEMSPSSS